MPVTWTGSAGVAGSLGAGQLASHLGLSPSSPFPVSDGEPILPATVLSSLARRRITQSLGSMDPKGTNLGVPTTFSEPAAQGPAGRLEPFMPSVVTRPGVGGWRLPCPESHAALGLHVPPGSRSLCLLSSPESEQEKSPTTPPSLPARLSRVLFLEAWVESATRLPQMTYLPTNLNGVTLKTAQLKTVTISGRLNPGKGV